MVLFQTPHRSLHHSFLPKFSLHLLSPHLSHPLPLFPAAMQHLFHGLIQHFFVFRFNQKAAFSIFYTFPASRNIACDDGTARCGSFQQDIAHSFVVTWKDNAVCFYVKHSRIGLKAVKMGDSAVFQFFYLIFLFLFKKTDQIQNKIFIFFFQPSDSIKQFVHSFFFHNAPEIQEMHPFMIGIGCHLIALQIDSGS